MALSLALCAAHMVDYGAKVTLVAYLGCQPSLRAHGITLAAAHVAANVHNAFLFFRGVPRVPLLLLPVLVLVFGLATPLMQVVHVFDAFAAWWVSQDMSGHSPLRAAPLHMVLEGVLCAIAAMHLRVSLLLGALSLEPPPPADWVAALIQRGLVAAGFGEVRFESVLTAAAVTSLAMVAIALVIWDSCVSLKLSRDMYGWPSPVRATSVCRPGRFPFAHLACRGSEVAGKSALLAGLAALVGTSCVLGYIVVCYLFCFFALVLLSPKKDGLEDEGGTGMPSLVLSLWPVLESSIVAWPLLFANLPQFVDCPRHAGAASCLAGLVCGFRALELSVVTCAVLAAVLLEDDAVSETARSLGFGMCGLGVPGVPLGGPAAQGLAELLRAWRLLYDRNSTLAWGCCLLFHYGCMVSRWCSCQRPPASLLPGPSGGSPGPSGSGAFSPGDEKDFWPPAQGLAALLLSAASERAPLAWPLDLSSAAGAGAPGRGRPRGRGGGIRPNQRRLEDFQTLRRVGSGEFGKVYQVRQRSTQEVYAMKVLSKEFYARRRMTEKAIREIATLHLARDHPFVVRLLCTIETAREWALVMEYCPHGDLQQLLLTEGSPGLSLSRTLRLSAEVVLALEHLHARGIVFRDLKLENVVLDHDGHAKLTDFGLAKQHSGGKDAISEAELAGDVYCSFTKTFCGSHGYAAPEVNPRRQVHGFAADMYSFGVLLLMLLMGGEVYHETREPPWERRLPPETPENLRNIVNSLTFEFYWVNHHFLAPARSSYRMEVNPWGSVVLLPRGPRGARRQERPRRPPNSPRSPRGSSPAVLVSLDDATGPQSSPAAGGGSAAAAAGPLAVRLGNDLPPLFPAAARDRCEAVQRRWDLALDLVRILTNEFPEHRGTIARVKQHAFFSEQIADWRTVYPKKWLRERVEAKLHSLHGRASLPARWEQCLQRLSAEELASLQDDPSAYAFLLEQASLAESPAAPTQEQLPMQMPAQGGAAAARSPGGAVSRREAQHAWVGHYT